MRWKVSAKWLGHLHDCTAQGIEARCHGGCCKSAAYWPPNAYAGPDNPDTVCGNLGPQGCRLSDADKPISCLLYPLVLNSAGTLILHHRTQFKTSCCKGNHGQGPPLIEALRGQLCALFGEAQYEEVKAAVELGADAYFEVPPAILAAHQRELIQEAKKERPVPRSLTKQEDERGMMDFRPDWRVGDARDLPELCADAQADLVFTCPPYADLERYSDDPRDLSTLDYPAFLEAYRDIIAKACARLKEDRFAVVVVGEVRDSKGNYYNFVGDTVRAFLDAGLSYYNEAILVTAVGSLPIRVSKMFTVSRKVGKTHQNVLVFCKGDPRKATEACGHIEIPDASFAGLKGSEDAGAVAAL